jgi:hypothetical protein
MFPHKTELVKHRCLFEFKRDEYNNRKLLLLLVADSNYYQFVTINAC